jgi:hypothetical protein
MEVEAVEFRVETHFRAPVPVLALCFYFNIDATYVASEQILSRPKLNIIVLYCWSTLCRWHSLTPFLIY